MLLMLNFRNRQVSTKFKLHDFSFSLLFFSSFIELFNFLVCVRLSHSLHKLYMSQASPRPLSFLQLTCKLQHFNIRLANSHFNVDSAGLAERYTGYYRFLNACSVRVKFEPQVLHLWCLLLIGQRYAICRLKSSRRCSSFDIKV